MGLLDFVETAVEKTVDVGSMVYEAGKFAAPEVFEKETVDRIEIAFNRENNNLFEKQNIGQMTLICGVIVIRTGLRVSAPIDAHECVHVSQFILSKRMSITDFSKTENQEIQADIVERYFSLLKQLRRIFRKKRIQ